MKQKTEHKQKTLILATEHAQNIKELQKEFPSFDFDCSPPNKSIIVNKHVIGNIKLKRLGPEKVPIK